MENSIYTATMADGQNDRRKRVPARPTVFDHPRDFLDNHFVYTVISPRARGLSVGVNMNPDKRCNFDCLYCEVNRAIPCTASKLDAPLMAAELRRTLVHVSEGKLHTRPNYLSAPEELLKLRHVTLSGDGEPTLAANFEEALEAVVHVRALGQFPFFKLVLITNCTGLDQPQVRHALRLFTKSDEIWAKLDAGTQDYLNKIARPDGVTLEKILSNILLIGKQRPVVIQSLFPAINDEEPPASEIAEYAHRLKELSEAGAQISLVQIYSATRPMFDSQCSHLPLRTLSHIAQTVRQIAGLKAEVF